MWVSTEYSDVYSRANKLANDIAMFTVQSA